MPPIAPPRSPARRSLLAGALASPALMAAGPIAARIPAEEDPAVAGNAALYRTRVGAIRVTVLSDGQIEFPAWPAYAPDATQAEVAAALRRRHLSPPNYRLDLNAVLIETAAGRVLLDTGWAGFAPGLGRLDRGLRAAGLAPGDIDLVVLTHLHPDHVGGLSEPDGTAAFERAEILVAAPELAQWQAGPDFGAMRIDARLRPVFEAAAATVTALGSQLRAVGPAEEILPGLTLWALPGHTRGHSGLEIASDGERLVCAGDTFHDQAFDLDQPGWATAFDYDPHQAEATRRRLLDAASSDGTRLLAYHMPFPGLGRVARAGEGYLWTPERWQLTP
ncbi:MAG: MBL fold metallo-hydrolase [Paracoccaceae bacterium]